MKVIEKGITILGVIFFLWLLISWVNVISHNDPSGEDGYPATWNAFVIITDLAEVSE